MNEIKKNSYKFLDYLNINHHDFNSVENNFNEHCEKNVFQLIAVIDTSENNTNKDGKSSRFRYILKNDKNEN